MEIMRKFVINLKPDGTVKWAEVADNKAKSNAYQNAVLRIIKFINNDILVIDSVSGEYFNGMKRAYEKILAIIIDELSKRG